MRIVEDTASRCSPARVEDGDVLEVLGGEHGRDQEQALNGSGCEEERRAVLLEFF